MRAVAAFVTVLVLLVGSAAPARASGPVITLEPIVTGYKRPLLVVSHSGPNRLYVVEQRGVVRVLRRESTSAPWQKAGVFLDIRPLVKGPFVGRGLLGMTFHPNYASNGLFYVFYTREPDGHIAIVEYRRRTNLRARPGSARPILVIPHPGAYHFGGWLEFGPDGLLFASTGDAAGAAATPPSQDPHSLLGKVLRLNPAAPIATTGQVPPGNPFADGVGGHPLVWSVGLRNPWRASFDAVTGDLWLPDVGQSTVEELNVFRDYTSARGANLGWSACEGSLSYPIADPPVTCAFEGSVAPVHEYSHAEGNCSIIGGHVYRGTENPSLAGRYFFADYCTGNIWSVSSSYAGGAIDAPFDAPIRISSFGVDSLGELYMTAPGGTVWQVTSGS